MQKLIVWALAALAIPALVLVANLGSRTMGLSFAVDAPAARLARLSPHWQILRPESNASGGGAILLSGCDGVRDNMLFWAREFVRQGRVAMILDSHTPRGLDHFELWRLVCAGQLLDGGQRSGDLAVGLRALTESEGVTADVVILGASHGGWTAMEFVARASTQRRPPGLTQWPAPPRELLRRVSGLILLYPYCGLLNRADAASWQAAPATLMVLAERDSIVDPGVCLARVEVLRESGAQVETATIPGADHGFDQQEKALFSTLPFSPAQRDAALADVRAFLSKLSNEG